MEYFSDIFFINIVYLLTIIHAALRQPNRQMLNFIFAEKRINTDTECILERF